MNKLLKTIVGVAFASGASLALAQEAGAPAIKADGADVTVATSAAPASTANDASPPKGNPYAFSYREYQQYSGTGAVWKAPPKFSNKADDPVPSGGPSYSQLQAESSESPVWQSTQGAPSGVAAADPVPKSGPSYAELQAESSESPVWQSPNQSRSSALASADQRKVSPAPAVRWFEDHVASFFHRSPTSSTN